MKQSVKDLQTLIVQSGDRVDIDGIYGKQTRGAIERMRVPNWLKTAMKEIGVRETHGVRHTERVLQYHEVSGGFSTDEIPWCGS
jgi:lysozyme family protein